MKRLPQLFRLYADFLPLSACSGSNGVMHTNDGRTIVSDGKPRLITIPV